MVACREGHHEIIMLYASQYKGEYNINKRMKDGWTALMYASMNGFVSMVSVLVEDCGADVDVLDRLDKNALHWAARYDNRRVVERLLQLKITYDQVDVEG